MHLWEVPEGPRPSPVFAEAVSSLSWSLTQLGHQVSRSTGPDSGQVFVFGANLLPAGFRLPPGCVIMNYEQFPAWRPHLPELYRGHRIWNYEAIVQDRFDAAGLPGTLVRLGWTPVFDGYGDPPQEPVVDVFFAGYLTDYRIKMLVALHRRGVRVACVRCAFGRERELMLRRCRLAINLRSYPDSPFMPIRMFVSWGLALPIVSDSFCGQDRYDLGPALPSADDDALLDLVESQLADPHALRESGAAGQAWLRARPYLPEVERALDTLADQSVG